MAREFTSLPDTHDKVNEVPFQSLIEMVIDLTDPGSIIAGTAGMQVNAFLAHAAVRMAKAIAHPVQEDRTLTVDLVVLDQKVRLGK